MDNFSAKRIGTALARTACLFALFGLISFLSRLIFRVSLLDEDMLSSRGVAGWNTAFLFLIFESTVMAVNRHATAPRQAFCENCKKSGQYGRLSGVFKSLDFYIEYTGVALLSLIVPLYDCVGEALYGEEYGKIQVMAVVLPVLLLLELIAHVSVRGVWLSDGLQGIKKKKKKEKSDLALGIKSCILVFVVYGGASVVIPWFLPFLVTISNLGAGPILFLYIALALVAVALLLTGRFYLRAMGKRRAFVRKLKKYNSSSIVISDVKKPCLSLFSQQKGSDFTVEREGVRYECKLVAGVFPSSPIIFSDTGEGVRQDTLRLFKVDLLTVNTRIDYRMESDTAKKIVIVLPVPQNIYVSVQGNPPRPADTGEKAGVYTIYNATGFIGALERGHLG